MVRAKAASVAASREWVDQDGVRQPGGDVHAWLPGTNQTLCGRQLSRSRLHRFLHVPFDFRSTDVVTPADEVVHICPSCVAATGGRRRGRSWERVSPRP